MVRNALANQPPAFLSGGNSPASLSEGNSPVFLSEKPADQEFLLPPIEKAEKRIPDPVKAFGAGVLGGAGATADLPVRAGKYASNKVFNTNFDTSKGWFPATQYYLDKFEVQDPDAFSSIAARNIGSAIGGEAALTAITGGAGLGLSALGKSVSRIPKLSKSINRVGEFLSAISKGRTVARASIDAGIFGGSGAYLDKYTNLPEEAKIPILFAISAGTGALLNKGGAKLAERKLFAQSKKVYEQATKAGSNSSEYFSNFFTKDKVRQAEEILAPIRLNTSSQAKGVINSFDKVLSELRAGKDVSSRALIEGDRSISRALFAKDVPNNIKSVGIEANNFMRDNFLKQSMPPKAYELLRKGNSLASVAHDIRSANGKVLSTVTKLPIKFSTKAVAYMAGGLPAVKALLAGSIAVSTARATKFSRELAKVYQKNPEFREAVFNLYSHALRGASIGTLTRLAKKADQASGYNEKPDFLDNAPPAFLTKEDEDDSV